MAVPGSLTSFHHVADNLRQSFRALAHDKPRASVTDLPGVSIASLGVSFQMFNAAFLNQTVETQAELEERLQTAQSHFEAQRLRWSYWIFEDWLAPGLRRRLSRTCENFGLRLSSEMPGMAAPYIKQAARQLPPMEVRRVQSPLSQGETLNDFRGLGSTCFHVPIIWFAEVFDPGVAARDAFICWVGYREGVPIATAATVSDQSVIGVYNVATLPAYRRHGYAEAITRHAIDEAIRETGSKPAVLQSTSEGSGLYRRMGFQTVTRVLVYNSTP